MRVARQSRFHRILGWGISRRRGNPIPIPIPCFAVWPG